MTSTLLRGAHVITMTADRPDAERLDILIADDAIAAIGENPPDAADVVDFAGRIIIPGLINAHLHTWQTALRTVGADWTMLEYLRHVHGELGPRYRPDDVYIATLVGALSQINRGTTTIGDWAHNSLTADHADASLEALKQSGVRALFLHGIPGRTPETTHPLAEVDRLLDVPTHSLVTVGMAIAGPQTSTPQVAIADFRAAAERGIVASMHQSGGPARPAWEAVSSADLFTPLTNVQRVKFSV